MSSGNVGIGTTGIAGTSNAVNLTTSGASGAITVLANGNVGIGTTTPLTKLHIEGPIKTGNPIFQVSRNAAAVFYTSSTLEINAWDTVDINTINTGWNSSNGRYTVSIPGYYYCSATVRVDGTGGGNIRKNGTIFIANSYIGSITSSHITCTGIIYAGVNEYISVFSVGTGTLIDSGKWNRFSVYMISS